MVAKTMICARMIVQKRVAEMGHIALVLRRDLAPSFGIRVMPLPRVRASVILSQFHEAETDLVGKAVVLTDGKAGTIEMVCLDELHGLRITVKGHQGKWPVSTIKFLQS
jgi:hypothetical protein